MKRSKVTDYAALNTLDRALDVSHYLHQYLHYASSKFSADGQVRLSLGICNKIQNILYWTGTYCKPLASIWIIFANRLMVASGQRTTFFEGCFRTANDIPSVTGSNLTAVKYLILAHYFLPVAI